MSFKGESYRMQNVIFVNAQNQRLAIAAMDVPRNGEQVVLGSQFFTVSGVRYFVGPNNAVQVAVLLMPHLTGAALDEAIRTINPIE